MRIAGARHRDRAAQIAEAVAGFIRNGLLGLLELEAGRIATALSHEPGNYAVENRAVVEAGSRPV